MQVFGIAVPLFRYFTCCHERFCDFQALLGVPAAVTYGMVFPELARKGENTPLRGLGLSLKRDN